MTDLFSIDIIDDKYYLLMTQKCEEFSLKNIKGLTTKDGCHIILTHLPNKEYAQLFLKRVNQSLKDWIERHKEDYH